MARPIGSCATPPLSCVTAGSELGFSDPQFLISKTGKVFLPVGIAVWVNKMPREDLAQELNPQDAGEGRLDYHSDEKVSLLLIY